MSEIVTVDRADLAALLNPPFGSYCVWQACGDPVAAEVMDEWTRRRDKVRRAIVLAERAEDRA